MEKIYRFYKLTDPRYKSIRYIGQTRQSLYKRLRSHISYGITGPDWSHKVLWLSGMIESGYEPIIELLEEMAIDNQRYANIREHQWIYYHLMSGCQLVNFIGNSKLVRNLLVGTGTDIFNMEVYNTIIRIQNNIPGIHISYNEIAEGPDLYEEARIYHRTKVHKVIKSGIFPKVVNARLELALSSPEYLDMLEGEYDYAE